MQYHKTPKVRKNIYKKNFARRVRISTIQIEGNLTRAEAVKVYEQERAAKRK